MARPAVGKAFKISRKQASGYGYAKPGMRSNPAVTAIAAINGPGAYGRSRTRRRLTASERAQFGRKVRSAKRSGMKSNASSAQIAAARKNIRKAIAARQAKRRPSSGRQPSRRTATTRRRSNMRSNRASAAQRRAALRNLRKARAALRKKRGGRRRLSRNVAAKRPRRKATRRKATRRPATRRKATRRRAAPRRRMRRNARQTAAQRRASLRNLRKARASSRRGVRRKATRRRKTTRRKATRRRAAPRRRMRRNARQTAAQRRASLRNLRKARAASRRRHKPNRRRKATRRRKPARRRKAARRRAPKRRMRRNRGQTAAQRRASLRNLRKARATSRRRGGRRKYASKRRSKGKRRSYRRNRRGALSRLFRRNQGLMKTLTDGMKTGVLVTGGFVAHKALTKVFTDVVLSRIFGAPATPVAPVETPPATSGLDALQPYAPIIGGFVTAAAGLMIANKVIKDAETRKYVSGGIAASFLHTLLVTVIDRVAPQAAGYLAGYDDGTAARLSAMYGLGAGTSIQPHYAPIGEYFTEGMGEYFTEPLGEYFTEGVSGGIGNYGSNPDLYQAAAGFGAMDHNNGNHIDPASDLDRELSIAEAAAGVGQLPAYEAAAGTGAVLPFEASAGVGAISRVPTTDTWVPGTSDSQLWAGVRAISRPQPASELTPAGVLQTDGGQGVFG